MACSPEVKINIEMCVKNTVFAQSILDTLDLPPQNYHLLRNELSGLSFSSETLTIDVLKKRAQLILTNVLNNALALELLKKSLLNNGTISVVFKAHANMVSHGQWRYDRREIAIVDNNNKTHFILNTFVFELSNSANEKLNKICVFDFHDPEDFALKSEMAEYETLQNAAKILRFGVENCQWPKKTYSKFYRNATDFKQHLEYVKKSSLTYHGFSHFDVYKLEYCKLKIAHLNCVIADKQHWLTTFLTLEKAGATAANPAIDLKKIQLELRTHEQARSILIEQITLLKAEAIKEKNRLTSEKNRHDVSAQEVQQLSLEDAPSDNAVQAHNTQGDNPLMFSSALVALEIENSDAGLPETVLEQQKAKSFQFKNCCVLL